MPTRRDSRKANEGAGGAREREEKFFPGLKTAKTDQSVVSQSSHRTELEVVVRSTRPCSLFRVCCRARTVADADGVSHATSHETARGAGVTLPQSLRSTSSRCVCACVQHFHHTSEHPASTQPRFNEHGRERDTHCSNPIVSHLALPPPPRL